MDRPGHKLKLCEEFKPVNLLHYFGSNRRLPLEQPQQCKSLCVAQSWTLCHSRAPEKVDRQTRTLSFTWLSAHTQVVV